MFQRLDSDPVFRQNLLSKGPALLIGPNWVGFKRMGTESSLQNTVLNKNMMMNNV
jgi:hypothetical protein